MENQKQDGDEWSIRAGTVYVSNSKARGDFVVGTPGSEFIEEEHILRDGETTYLWLNGSHIIPVETEVWRSNPEYGMKGITFGQLVLYEWRCTEGKNSPFMFKLPGAFPVDR